MHFRYRKSACAEPSISKAFISTWKERRRCKRVETFQACASTIKRGAILGSSRPRPTFRTPIAGGSKGRHEGGGAFPSTPRASARRLTAARRTGCASRAPSAATAPIAAVRSAAANPPRHSLNSTARNARTPRIEKSAATTVAIDTGTVTEPLSARSRFIP